MKRAPGPPRTSKPYKTPQPMTKSAQGAPQRPSGPIIERHTGTLYGVSSVIDGLIIELRSDPEMPREYLAEWEAISAAIDSLIP